MSQSPAVTPATVVAFLAVAYALSATPGESRTGSAERELAAIVCEVTDGEGHADPGSERFEELAGDVWALVGERVADVLTERPNASAAELVAAVEALNDATPPSIENADFYAISATVVPLGGNPATAWAVAVGWYYSGSFLVVARVPSGTWEVAWRVRDLALGSAALCDELDRWLYYEPGYHDGPFGGTAIPLPASGTGRPRFAVIAEAQPSMGLVRPGQISVWEWDGVEAVPVFFGWFETAWGGQDARFAGSSIELRTMQNLKTGFVCGSCEVSPEEIWRLEITPDGVLDHGKVSDTPGLDLVDELVDRVAHEQDATDIAEREVVDALKTWFADSDNGPDYSLGMLESWSSVPTPGGRRVEIGTDWGLAVFGITGNGAAARVTSFAAKPMEWPEPTQNPTS